MHNNKKCSPGFTLIECMVVLLVVAILVIVAYPSYQEHLKKGRRAAAQSFLVDLASRQQQYLADSRTYAVGGSALTALNMTVPADVSRFYSITVQPAANERPPRFTVAATPIAGTQQATDGVLTITETGAKTHNGVSGW